jgi:hypothetical protein
VRDRAAIKYFQNIAKEDRPGIAQPHVAWQLIDRGKEARLEQRCILALQPQEVDQRSDPGWSSYFEIMKN